MDNSDTYGSLFGILFIIIVSVCFVIWHGTKNIVEITIIEFVVTFWIAFGITAGIIVAILIIILLIVLIHK